MNMQEVENILRIFKETKKAVEKKDTYQLKILSDQTNNTASRTHDLDNIAIAVIIYSIEKILEREEYRKYPKWENFYKNLKFHIDRAIIYLKKNNEEEFSKCLKEIRKEMGHFSGKLKGYIKDVLRKASVNKASKIYEHGISMERTANLLGITLWELADYIGQKESLEINNEKDFSVKSRIKLAMEMFE
jgi:hypothetical protein